MLCLGLIFTAQTSLSKKRKMDEDLHPPAVKKSKEDLKEEAAIKVSECNPKYTLIHMYTPTFLHWASFSGQ